MNTNTCQKNTVLNIITLMCIVLLIFFSNGCLMVMHDVTIAKYPSLRAEIIKAPPLKPGYSRIIAYSPRAPLGGVLGGGMTVISLVIENQHSIYNASLFDQTGFYIDVPSGDYKISAKMPPVYDNSKSITTTFEASKTYTIKVDSAISSAFGLCLSKYPEVLDGVDEVLQKIEKDKIRFTPPIGMDPRFTEKLTMPPALIPKIEASSLWVSSDPDQKRQSATARIYVFNKVFIVGYALRPFVGINCLPDIEVPKTKYVCFETTPGRHVFSIKTGCFTESGLFSSIGYTIDLKQDEDVFIEFTAMQGWKFMSEKDAQKLIKNKSKITKGGYYRLRATSHP